MNDNKIKFTKKMMALLVAGGITLAPINGSCAKTHYKEGTFVKESTLDEKPYGEYVVKEGDNLSRISEKICSHFRVEISTKYWPAIAFLNNYPRIIEPGDIIVFPKSFEALVELNNKLRKIGWTSRYIQKNKIYGKKKNNLSIATVASLLANIYGNSVCIDEDFIRLYLRIHGLEDRYNLTDTQLVDNEALFYLTEWIPTLEELEEFRLNNAGKVKRK